MKISQRFCFSLYLRLHLLLSPFTFKTMASEDEQLKMKFRSLTYTSPKRQQKLREVTEEGKKAKKDYSYQTWKRLNPGYFEGEMETTQQAMQRYEEGDFHNINKERFRVKDKYTEYVEYVVRDHALARSNKK